MEQSVFFKEFFIKRLLIAYLSVGEAAGQADKHEFNFFVKRLGFCHKMFYT